MEKPYIGFNTGIGCLAGLVALFIIFPLAFLILGYLSFSPLLGILAVAIVSFILTYAVLRLDAYAAGKKE